LVTSPFREILQRVGFVIEQIQTEQKDAQKMNPVRLLRAGALKKTVSGPCHFLIVDGCQDLAADSSWPTERSVKYHRLWRTSSFLW
jgi:hypothetical protein